MGADRVGQRGVPGGAVGWSARRQTKVGDAAGPRPGRGRRRRPVGAHGHDLHAVRRVGAPRRAAPAGWSRCRRPARRRAVRGRGARADPSRRPSGRLRRRRAHSVAAMTAATSSPATGPTSHQVGPVSASRPGPAGPEASRARTATAAATSPPADRAGLDQRPPAGCRHRAGPRCASSAGQDTRERPARPAPAAPRPGPGSCGRAASSGKAGTAPRSGRRRDTEVPGADREPRPDDVRRDPRPPRSARRAGSSSSEQHAAADAGVQPVDEQASPGRGAPPASRRRAGRRRPPARRGPRRRRAAPRARSGGSRRVTPDQVPVARTAPEPDAERGDPCGTDERADRQGLDGVGAGEQRDEGRDDGVRRGDRGRSARSRRSGRGRRPPGRRAAVAVCSRTSGSSGQAERDQARARRRGPPGGRGGRPARPAGRWRPRRWRRPRCRRRRPRPTSTSTMTASTPSTGRPQRGHDADDRHRPRSAAPAGAAGRRWTRPSGGRGGRDSSSVIVRPSSPLAGRPAPDPRAPSGCRRGGVQPGGLVGSHPS